MPAAIGPGSMIEALPRDMSYMAQARGLQIAHHLRTRRQDFDGRSFLK